ncbi:MAG: hypothetical protein SPL30_07730 [Succinivibrio sp.]|jgi:predicted porin|nr:hypothetical protein [Succinivibrio sp.]
MSRKILSLSLAAAAVTAACCAQAAPVYDKDGTQLDIFGRAEAMFMNDHAIRSQRGTLRDASASGDNTVAGAARFGIAGRSRLSDSVSGIGLSELELPIGESADGSVHVRYLYAGINAQQYGTLIAGRGDSAYTAVAGATDIYDALDLNTNDYYLFGDTASGRVMYSLSAMGWDFRLSLQTASDSVNDTFDVDSGYAFSFATRLSNGITVAYGADYTDFSYEGCKETMTSFFGEMYDKAQNRVVKSADPKAYGLNHHPSYKVNKGIAISYGTLGRGFYAGFLYNVTRYKGLPHHIYTYETAFAYSFDCGVTLRGGWSAQQWRDASVIEDLNLGISYSPAPAFKVFAEAQLDLGANPERLYPDSWIKDHALGENRFVAGARYSF